MARWFELMECGESFYETAQFRIVQKVEISAPAEKIFDALADEGLWSQWLPIIARMKWNSSAPYGIGSSRAFYLKTGGRIDEKIIAWEPNARLATMGTGATVSNMISLGSQFVIVPKETGCELRWTFALQPRGLRAHLLFFMQPGFRRFYKKRMLDLKALIEARV